MKRQITLALLPILIAIFLLTLGHITIAAPGDLDVILGNSGAATITVTNTNDSGAGSLRQAVADASPGSTIDFNVTGTITLTSGQLVIDKNVTIQGPGANLLSISGNNESRVFYINSGVTATLAGMTVKDGLSQGGWGGGILNGGTLTVGDSILSGNNANTGGGIFNESGTVTINNSTVSFNSNNDGGGGIHNYYGMLSVSNSSVSGNGATYGSGGIHSFNGTIAVSNSTVSNNTVTYGGTYSNGGISNEFYCFNPDGCDPSTAYITNSTISGNTFYGIYGYGSETLTNSVVANNTSGDVFGTIEVASHNLIGNAASSGGITNGVNGNIVGVNPLLGPLQNNGGPTFTHALLPGSPAINAGNNCVLTANGCGNGNPALPTDQRGMPRNGIVDIGAFELQGGPFPTPTPAVTPTPPPTPTPDMSVCAPSLTVTEIYPGSLNGFTSIAAGQNSVTVDIADGGLGLQGFSVVSASNANVSIPAFPPGTHQPLTATFTIPSPGQPVDFTLRAGARSIAVLIRAQCSGGPVPTPTPVITPTPPPPSPTPNVTPTPAPSPTPGGTCTPMLTVSEVFPGSAGAFQSITAGPGSVTVDIADSGIGLQSITLLEAAANASVAIPPFAPGTYQPVTITFSVQNAGQPVAFTLRASARLNSVLIRARCGSAAARNQGPGNGLPDTSFWLPGRPAFIEDLV